MELILSETTDHCHAPNPDEFILLEARNQIKSRALDTQESPSSIVQSVLQAIPSHLRIFLPEKESLIKSIRRYRDSSEKLKVNGSDAVCLSMNKDYITI